MIEQLGVALDQRGNVATITTTCPLCPAFLRLRYAARPIVGGLAIAEGRKTATAVDLTSGPRRCVLLL